MFIHHIQPTSYKLQYILYFYYFKPNLKFTNYVLKLLKISTLYFNCTNFTLNKDFVVQKVL